MNVIEFPGLKRRAHAPPPPPPGGGTRPRSSLKLPTFHADQVNAFFLEARFRVIRAGRRWGKTLFAGAIASDWAIKGAEVGWFAPTYKLQMESFRDIDEILSPIVTESNKSLNIIRTRTGGRVDFWSLEDDRAGRSRKYRLVIIDEAAFAKANAMEIWERSIRPTLVDFRGAAIVTSNTNGADPQNFLYRLCKEEKFGFREYHAPSRSNPHLPAEELEELRQKSNPLVFQQEYEAEFVDWRGVAFFALDKMLVDGKPVEWPALCDGVFATMDTAIKAGTENDGSAVVYWALITLPEPKLVLLDWEIRLIEGSLLEEWMPAIFARLESLAKTIRTRFGTGGVFIEDKNSGSMLLQAGERRGWPVNKIDTALTDQGKDQRAIAVSGHHWEGKAKISRHAYDKTVMFKGQEINHLLSQVTGFRIGDKEGSKRADDLTDCYMYGLSIGLGDSTGF